MPSRGSDGRGHAPMVLARGDALHLQRDRSAHVGHIAVQLGAQGLQQCQHRLVAGHHTAVQAREAVGAGVDCQASKQRVTQTQLLLFVSNGDTELSLVGVEVFVGRVARLGA